MTADHRPQAPHHPPQAPHHPPQAPHHPPQTPHHPPQAPHLAPQAPHLAPLPPPHAGPAGTRRIVAVKYAAVSGYRPLELDLHLPPAGPDPAPAVVFLHGGGWRLGSRESAGPMFGRPSPFERAAAAGLAVASVDYRLSAEARWPAPLHDAKAAVRWLRRRAGELGVDPGRISAWGESAGGHLAALLGLTAGNPALEGDAGVTGLSSHVSAVAAWYPPTGLAGFGDPNDPESREAHLLGAAPAAVPARAAEASPLTHVTAAAPPFLLLHGRADRLVPCQQSEALATALREAGAPVALKVFEGADHMWLGAPDTADAALSETIDFLLRAPHVA